MNSANNTKLTTASQCVPVAEREGGGRVQQSLALPLRWARRATHTCRPPPAPARDAPTHVVAGYKQWCGRGWGGMEGGSGGRCGGWREPWREPDVGKGREGDGVSGNASEGGMLCMRGLYEVPSQSTCVYICVCVQIPLLAP